MSVRRTYACDLCGDAYAPEELIGWEFDGFREGRHPLRRAGARSTEHHFCPACLIAVRQFAEAVEASGVWPDKYDRTNNKEAAP